MAAKVPHFDIYRDARKGWRWRIRARNGKIVADCAESYKTRRAALRGIRVVTQTVDIRDPNGNMIEVGW